jgi:hypothetical protein
MANPFVHVELSTTDVDKAKSFYQSLFAWQLNDMEMGGGMTYTLIQVGEGTGGGMMKHPMPGAPSAWLPYVLVDDIRGRTKRNHSAPRLCATSPRSWTKARFRSLSTRWVRCSGSGNKERSNFSVGGPPISISCGLTAIR